MTSHSRLKGSKLNCLIWWCFGYVTLCLAGNILKLYGRVKIDEFKDWIYSNIATNCSTKKNDKNVSCWAITPQGIMSVSYPCFNFYIIIALRKKPDERNPIWLPRSHFIKKADWPQIALGDFSVKKNPKDIIS